MPRPGYFSVTIDEKHYNKLVKQAKRNNRSLSGQAETLIDDEERLYK